MLLTAAGIVIILTVAALPLPAIGRSSSVDPNSCVGSEGLVRPVPLDNGTFLGNAIEVTVLVQYCNNGQFEALCHTAVTSIDAMVACRSFNFTEGSAIVGNDPSYSGPIYNQDPLCTGSESQLSMCPTTPIMGACTAGTTIISCRALLSASPPPTACADGELGPMITVDFSMLPLQLAPSGNLQYSIGPTTLEMCVGGMRGGICSRGFTDEAVLVACRNIHTGFGIATGGVAVPNFGLANQILVQDVVCIGRENSLRDCLMNSVIDNECSAPTMAVSVTCEYEVPCSFLNGRLTPLNLNITYNSPSSGSLTGLLLQCVNGRFGGICDRGFTRENAQVACRELTSELPLNITGSEVLFGINNFGGQILTQDVSCTGSEPAITSCPHSIVTDIECRNTARAVRVRCSFDVLDTGTPCVGAEGAISLFPLDNGTFSFTPDGTPVFSLLVSVEYCDNGQFGAICSSAVSPTDAVVICRSLGFTTGQLVGSDQEYFGDYVQDPMCTGPESQLYMCPMIPINGSCTSGAAIISCQQITGTGTATIPGTAGTGVTPSCSEGVISVPQSAEVAQQVQIGASGFLEFVTTSTLEVCVNGRMGAICSRGITNEVALVACRSQGPGNPIRGVVVSNPFPYFGEIVLQDMVCTGSEGSLNECSASRDVDIGCSDPSNALTIQCYYQISCENTPSPVVPLHVDYTPPSTNFTAFLLGCVNGKFGGICDKGFDNMDATVACRDLSTILPLRSTGGEVFRGSYNYDGPVLQQELECSGDEFSLSECRSNINVDLECNNSARAVAVRCFFEIDENGSGSAFGNGSGFGSGFGSGLMPFGPGERDSTLPYGDDSIIQVDFSIPIVISGQRYTTAFVSVDGIISIGDRFSGFFAPGRFPFQSPPIIAPFSIDLTTTRQGEVYYRIVNSDRYDLGELGDLFEIGDQAWEALVVTWDQVEVSQRSNTTVTFQAMLLTTGQESFALFLYDGSFHPDGAAVGINYGDGVSYTTILGSSGGIENTGNLPGSSGLYFYRLDGQTVVPTPSSLCSFDGDLRAREPVNTIRIGAQGLVESVIHINQIEVCVNGMYGGICDRNFEPKHAVAICSSLYGTVIGAEVYTSSQNYNGQIVLEDTSCIHIGTNNNCSSEVDSQCNSPDRAVGITCIFTATSFGTGPPGQNGTGPLGDYPYFDGTSNSRLLDNGNNAYISETLNIPIVFFGEEQYVLFVQTDGIVSFGQRCELCLPHPFPTAATPPLIAAFWKNFDTTNQGSVAYNTITNFNELAFIALTISGEFNANYSPLYAGLVTWSDLSEFRRRSPYSFQIVLTSDGVQSYALLSYGLLQDSSNAEVGFNLGDGKNFLSVGSLNMTRPNSVGLETRTNLVSNPIPGFYVFRLDDLRVFSGTTEPVQSTTAAELQSTGGAGRLMVPSVSLLLLFYICLLFLN